MTVKTELGLLVGELENVGGLLLSTDGWPCGLARPSKAGQADLQLFSIQVGPCAEHAVCLLDSQSGDVTIIDVAVPSSNPPCPHARQSLAKLKQLP